jgi:hypothetical protein
LLTAVSTIFIAVVKRNPEGSSGTVLRALASNR